MFPKPAEASSVTWRNSWVKAGFHAFAIVVVWWFWGPFSVLWAFWAEAVGLTIAWDLMMLLGARPFTPTAVFANLIAVGTYMWIDGLAWFASAVDISGPLPGADPLARLGPWAFGAFNALVWFMPAPPPKRVPGAPFVPRAPFLEERGEVTKAMPSPLPPLLLLAGAIFIQPILFFIVAVVFVLRVDIGTAVRILPLVPAMITATFVLIVQICMDFGMFRGGSAPLDPRDAAALERYPPTSGNTAYAPPGGTGRLLCANCFSPSLRSAKYKGMVPGEYVTRLVCGRCGARNRPPA